VSRAAAALAALLLPLLASPAWPASGPVYGRAPDGALSLGALPEVLSRPEVRRHLTTGLTTGLLVRFEARDGDGRAVRGAARVDVRWEPWDEVFHVTVVDGAGRVRRETLASFESLAAWWSALDVVVAPRAPATLAMPRVDLSVVPFSQSEQRDAQRWFSSAPAPETADGAQAGPGESRLNGVVDLLIATSIQRRSVVRYRWPALPAPAARPDR
jgi:hypothetical protein